MLPCEDALVRGWAVFPVRSRSKVPLTPHGFRDASRDRETVETWWERWPEANVGVPTGRVNGVVVVDVDPRHGGDEWPGLQQLPRTLTSRTGGGGWHLWFRLGEGDGGRVRSRRLAPGIDLKADGGYVVAPPSVHESGEKYEWLDPSAEMAEVPAWLLALVENGARGADLRIPVGSRHDTMVSLAGRLRAEGQGVEAILEALREANQWCAEPLEEDELVRIARSMENYPPFPNHQGSGSGAGNGAGNGTGGKQKLTDKQLGLMIAGTLGDRLRWTPGWGWMIWDGDVWRRDPESAFAMKLIRETIGVGEREFASNARLEAGLKAARAALHQDVKGYDREPLELNLGGGKAVDLRTGEVVGVSGDPTCRVGQGVLEGIEVGSGGVWERFVEEILPDEEVRDWVQRAVGYSATGSVREQVLFLCLGRGANGKSTFVSTIVKALGDYARVVPSLLDWTGETERATAQLAGCRFAYVQEAPTQRTWRTELLNKLTGEDQLLGRWPYQIPFTFQATHHLWLAANDLPDLEYVSPAVQRRLRIIPFTVNFRGREDHGLGSKLAGALGEVLDWIVRGAVAWHERGLADVPEACQALVEMAEMILEDDVTRWARERLEVKAGEMIPTARLYQDYRRWALVNDGEELNIRQFGRKLARLVRDHGWRVSLIRSNTARGWQGLALR